MGFAETVRILPSRTMRSLLISLSHRRSLARLATHTPIARPVVARFVAGDTLAEALPAIEELKRAGLRTTVDVLGELVTSPEQAQSATGSYLTTIAALSSAGLDVNVSVKLTALGLDCSRAQCESNVARIVEAASAHGGFVRIDMEDHTRTEATLAIWREVHETNPNVGVVIQSALRRSHTDVDRIIAAGGRVRLCKGAYDEPASVAYRTRQAVDANYARLMERLLRADAYPALATHDARLIARAIEMANRLGLARDRFEFQMLYGIRRDLQRTLVDRGYTVRVYVPYGCEWYPYFMRRLAERPANVGFMLRALAREESRRLRGKQPAADRLDR
jgi:proline dehydrogenase